MEYVFRELNHFDGTKMYMKLQENKTEIMNIHMMKYVCNMAKCCNMVVNETVLEKQ